MPSVNVSFKYPDGKLFHSLICAMEDILNHCFLIIGRDGVKIARMDANQVVMVELFLAKESFLEFPPSLPADDIELGISLKSMKKFCSTLTEDPLTFKATTRQINLIQKYTGVYEERKITLPIIDVDREGEAEPPESEWMGKATFSNTVFSHIIATSMTVHDTVEIEISRKKIEFAFRDDQHLNGRTTLYRTTEGAQYGLRIDPNTRTVAQLLPTNQLRKLSTTKEICNMVTVELTGGEDAVRFSFSIDDTESHLTFHVAPKIMQN